MARSLLQQFTQTRGTITYDDTMSSQYAEVAGRLKEGSITNVSTNGTTVTRSSGVWEASDEGNIILIAGQPYEIVSADGTADCTIDTDVGTQTGLTVALHYYQNLEDDLNYIRSRIKDVTGETTWSGSNTDTLVSLRSDLDATPDTFLDLTDTSSSYTQHNMLYMGTDGIYDTDSVTWNAGTSTFTVDGSASTVLTTSETSQVLGVAGDTRLELSQSSNTFDVYTGAENFIEIAPYKTDYFQAYFGDRTNHVYMEMDSYAGGTSFYALNDAETGAVEVAGFGGNVSLSPNGSTRFYASNHPSTNTDYVRIGASGDTYLNMNVYDDQMMFYIDNVDQLTMDSTGITLASGTNVNMIATSISEPGSDNLLVTEQAIVEYMGSVNGGTPTYMYYVDSNGDMATTSHMTYDPAGGYNSSGLLTLAPGGRTSFQAEHYKDGGSRVYVGDIDANAYTLYDHYGGQIEHYTDNGAGGASNIYEAGYHVQVFKASDTTLLYLYNSMGSTYATLGESAGTRIRVDGSSGAEQIDAYANNRLILTSEGGTSGDTALLSTYGSSSGKNSRIILSGDGTKGNQVNIYAGSGTSTDRVFHARNNYTSIGHYTGGVYNSSGDKNSLKIVFLNGTGTNYYGDRNGKHEFFIGDDSDDQSVAVFNLDDQRIGQYGDTYLTIDASSDYMSFHTDNSQIMILETNNQFQLGLVQGTSDSVYVNADFGLKNGIYVTVSGIITEITEPGSDELLATEQAIVEYVAQELAEYPQTFLALTDTEIASYTANNMLYTTSTGVADTSDMTYDPATGNINLGASGQPRFVADVENSSVFMYGDDDSFITISGSGNPAAYSNSVLVLALGDNVQTLGDSSDTYLTLTQDADTAVIGAAGSTVATFGTGGLQLASGATINDITTSVSGSGLDTRVVTEQGIVEYVTSQVGAQTFLALTDTFDSYTEGNMLYTTSTGVADTSSIKWEDPFPGFGLGNQFIVTNDPSSNYVSLAGNTMVFAPDAQEYVTYGVTLSGIHVFDSFFLSPNGLEASIGDGEPGGAASGARIRVFPENQTIDSYAAGDTRFMTGTWGARESNIQLTINSDGITLADGASVDNIATEISAPGLDTNLVTEQAVVEYVNTISGSLQNDVIWEIVDTPYTQIRPKAAHIDKATYLGGNLTIAGDLTVSGTTTTVHSEELTVADKLITVNAGEAGAGITGDPWTGIQVDRGSEEDYYFIFDEYHDNFRVGISGSLQAVATREDSPLDHRVTWWDAPNYMLATSGTTYQTINTSTGAVEIYSNSTNIFKNDYNGKASSMQIFLGDSSADYYKISAADSPSDSVVHGWYKDGSARGYIGVTDTWFYGGDGSTNSLHLANDATNGSTLKTGAAEVSVKSSVQKIGIVNATELYINAVADTYQFYVGDIPSRIVQLTVDSSGITLESGASVDEILDSNDTLSASSTDTQLATAKLIYEEMQSLTTGSGVVDHNLLGNLQGGSAPDTYYHVTPTQISNWNTAYGWGDHSSAGYLTSYNETDPVFSVSAAAGISSGDITNWNTAYNWGMDTEEPTGFLNQTDSAISFDDGTRTLTISGTSFAYYIKGTKYTKTGANSVQIGTAEGMHYVYYNGATLSTSDTWNNDYLSDYAYVAAIYWDASVSGHIYMGDERHGAVMDAATHYHLHNTVGTAYISGLTPNPTVVDGDGSSDTHAQLAVGSGYILDEDILHSIPADSAPAQIPVFYKSGASGNWNRDTATNFPVKPSSNVRLAYNQYTGGAWQQTEVGNADYVLAHIFATNDPNTPWIAIQGQNDYVGITAARAGANTEMENLITEGLPFAEFLPVATLIYRTDSSYTNSIKATIESTDTGAEFVDWRYAKISPVPGAASDHGTLLGLTDPDHPASAIYTSTSNFDGALSSADDTVQKALDTLDNAITVGGHLHYETDLTYVSGNTWTATLSGTPESMVIYLNGLKNRSNDTDYYTATVSGTSLTVEFAYDTYDTDWANVEYIVDQY